MPVVSPSRFSTSSSASLSSGSYRSTLSGSSLERPYYSPVTGSYIPRSSGRSSSISVSEYRSHRHTYDGDREVVRDRKTSVYCTSDYSRYGRAPSASDSDSGVSGVSRLVSGSGSGSEGRCRSDRSSPGPRSRDTSVSRSESRTSRPYLITSTAELYNKYSPANYVPLAQRLSTAVTGPNGETSRAKSIAGDASRLPPARRPVRSQEPEVKIPRPHSHTPTNPDKRHNTNSSNSTVARPCAVVPPECATNTPAATNNRALDTHAAKPKRDVECAQRLRAARPSIDTGASKSRTIIPRARLPPTWSEKKPTHNGYRGDSLSASDDNGNDLPLSVSDIRRKFDPKMTVTRLPSRDPDLLYKTALSSDNIYGQIRHLNSSSISSLVDDKPVPVHKPISSDKYTNGTTGSLKWEFLSPSPSPIKETKDSDDSGYSTKKSTESGSDSSNVSLNSVKNQLNANNMIGKILEKSTTIYVGSDESKNYNHDEPSKNVLSIEIGTENCSLNSSDMSKNVSKESVRHASNHSPGVEIRPKHTSDFASYIQVSAPAASTSPPNSGQKRYLSTLCNGDVNSDEYIHDNANESCSIRTKDDTSKSTTCLFLSPDEDDASNLRYIDSEPSLETDSKLIIDYEKDDGGYEDEGFENKTFEHANGHLLRKGEDGDSGRLTKQVNGIVKMVDDISDDDDDELQSKRKSKEDDCNSNVRHVRDERSSPIPDTPMAKRKYVDLNGESSSMYQIYQKVSTHSNRIPTIKLFTLFYTNISYTYVLGSYAYD